MIDCETQYIVVKGHKFSSIMGKISSVVSFDRTTVAACLQGESHRQNGKQVMDGQLSPESFFKHADGLMLQVVIGGNASVRQWLDGAIILEH